MTALQGSRHETDAALSLRASRLLGRLGEPRLRRLFGEGEIRTYAAGEANHLAWGAEAGVFFVLSGAFRVSWMTPDGRFVTLRSAGAGEQFGEIEAFSGEPFKISFMHCDQPGACFVLPSPDFRALASEDATLAVALLRAMAGEARRRADRIYEFATLDVRSRLLAELLRLARTGVREGSGVLINPAPTHDSLAAQVGATREGVTRHLQDFIRRGLVRVPRRRSLQIMDVSVLHALLAKQTGEHEPRQHLGAT